LEEGLSQLEARVMKCLLEQKKMSSNMVQGPVYQNIKDFEERYLKPLNSLSSTLEVEFFTY